MRIVKRKRKKQPEYHLQVQVCEYLNLQYPKASYLSDTVASISLTPQQQVRNKAIQKEGFKCPDVLILQPSNGYCGLFVELKVETPFKKNGELKAGEHLEGQKNTINDLNKKGYKALFSWGFDMTKKIIDEYMTVEYKTNKS